MSAGLQIFNASGVLLLDSSDRVGRIKGRVQVLGHAGSVACDMSDGIPFWSFQPDFMFAHISNQTPPPIITIDSNGIYWTYSSTSGLNYPNPITGWLFFGVY
ncbi:hypothetical protein OKW38_002472 [Paraburkholderia sp. MM5496-R1]